MGALGDLVTLEGDVTQGLVADGSGRDVGEALDLGQSSLGVGKSRTRKRRKE